MVRRIGNAPGTAALRASAPIPVQIKKPTTHQVYKNGKLTLTPTVKVDPNAPKTPPKVTPTQAGGNTTVRPNTSTAQGQMAIKEGIFTNPTTGIQTDRYGHVVTGKNKYGVVQTTGTTAPSALGAASPSTVSPYDIQNPDPSKTLYSKTPSATVPTATTPVVDIGGGLATTGVRGERQSGGTDKQRLADIAWKQHNGQPLSEEDFKYLVGQQLSGASSLAAQTQAAASAQETAAQDLIGKKQAEMEARAASQSKRTQGLVDQQKALLDEQAKAAIDQIKQNAMSEQTAGQNIMAFNGFGVSSDAIKQSQQIQAKYNAQSQAVIDAENLQLQQYQAQLQGVDQAVLDEMQANIDTLQANADEMAYSNALDVAQANADANVDPLTALSNIMQVLPPAQAQQVNTDVSKMLGYLADESGNPITFANGETIPIKVDTEFAKNMEALQQLVDSGASESVINAAMAGLNLTTADMQNFQFYSQLSDKGKADYIKLQQASKGVSLFNGADGQVYAVDGTSGTVTPLETGSGGAGTLNTGNRRVDANNNPAAFTTDVAKTMGLVEGVDYVQGDKFPGDSNLYTAKLLGDPIEITIRGIDNAGFTTQGGANRWSYTDSIPGANNKDWATLTYDQKARVISEMNKHEGGNGDLTIAQPGEYSEAQMALMDSLDPENLSSEDKKTLVQNGLDTTDLYGYIADNKAQLPPDKRSQIQEIYDSLLDLESTPGISGAVGFGIQKTLNEEGWSGTKTADFIAKFNTFKDSLALPNLDKMKGAMSDKDIQFLRNTASALSLNMSESEFKRTLEKLKSKYLELLNQGTNIAGESIESRDGLGIGTNSNTANPLQL